MSQVITEPARSGSMAGWRSLPREVRTRLRRTRFATVAQAPALAAWAQARWRRTTALFRIIPFAVISLSGLEFGAVDHGSGRVEHIVFAGAALTCVTMSLWTRPRNRRRANDLSVILTDAAHATIAATPSAAPAPLIVHRTYDWMVGVAGYVIVAAAYVVYYAEFGGVPVAGTIVAAMIALTATLDGIAGIRAIRSRGIEADLDRDGIRLRPDGPRIPWRFFSGVSADVSGSGRFDLDLAVRAPEELGDLLRRSAPTGRRRRAGGNPRSLSIDVSAIRERPLDVLIALRRYIAANDSA